MTFFRRIGAAGAVIAIAATTTLLLNTPGNADPNAPLQLNVVVTNDGTATFDANDNAGNDSGPSNGIVRVNDTVTYQLQYQIGANNANNTTITFALPQGMEFSTLPALCSGAGSAITPATAGTPALPLTANSVNELNAQTLTCNLGSRPANSTATVNITAKVLNVVHHGTALTPTSANITADGVTTPIAPQNALPTVTASAALKWDLTKNSTALVDNTGYRYGPAYSPCPWDRTKHCFVTGYTALIFAPTDGKGAMPAIGDITFTDDLSPRTLYPGLTEAQYVAMEANLQKYGSRIVAQQRNYLAPGSKIGITENGIPLTATNAVRNSGTMAIAQPGGPGTPVNFTVSGADMSLRTIPTQAARPVGTALAGNRAYAVSLAFDMYTPADTIIDFGIHNSTAATWSLPFTNRYTAFHTTGFTANDVQTIANQYTGNDYRSSQYLITAGGGFSKNFGGVPGTANNLTPAEFDPADSWRAEGLPGGGTRNSGEITVAPGQEVISLLYTRGASPAYPVPISQVMCDAWDNSLLHLKAKNWPASTLAGGQMVPSSGTAVWVSGYNNLPNAAGTDARNATSTAEVPAIKIQYSASENVAPDSGADSVCDNTVGQWYDNPADVPGNDVAKAAQGIYTAVNRVRIHTILPSPVGNYPAFGAGYFMQISVGLQVADSGAAVGTKIPNYVAAKRRTNVQMSLDEMLADTPTSWSPSTYNANAHSGALGDRLLLADAQARISKTVRMAGSGEFSSTPPSLVGGQQAEYRLAPSLTSPAPTTGILRDVWVEDCLPASQAFVEASLTPTLVANETPADAQRTACAPGDTYLRWVLPSHEVNTPITPITFIAEALPSAADGTYTNTVVVWSNGDASSENRRTAKADIQITNVAEMKLEKKAVTPVVQTNRAAQSTMQNNVWRVRLSNTLAAGAPVSNADIIDVLPSNGLNASSFNGTMSFASVETVVGNLTYRYSKAAPATISTDPRHTSNGPAGSTAWCDAPAGGNLVSGVGDCPASAAEVTAIRAIQPGPFASSSRIEFLVTTTAVGGHDGDTYDNVVGAAAEGFTFTLGPIASPEQAVASSIGDTVWFDTNGNGIQDTGETGVEGVTVRLTGTDDLGNAVDVTTTSVVDGTYVFDGLRSADANGYTVTFRLPEGLVNQGYEFTPTHAGSDTTVDSDADAHGVVSQVALAADTDRDDIDAGISRPDISLVKDADRTSVRIGETITYTFTATNTGTTVLSDVSLTEDSFTNANGDAITLDAPPALDANASTGTVDALAPGQRLVWTAPYTVTAEDLELGHSIDNVATVSGVSPRDTEVDDSDDATVDSDGEASFTYSKTAERASGSTVLSGEKIVYTLVVTHQGDLPTRGATLTDDLSAVLDDATMNDDVEATSGDVTIDDGVLEWTGDLMVGDIVTITYSVTVKGSGDKTLDNTATSTDDRGVCDTTVGCTTRHTAKDPEPLPPTSSASVVSKLSKTGTTAAMLATFAATLAAAGVLTLVSSRRRRA
ncbi:SdrD B-like domain-containing protein [Schaalia suimastitidis]|uniref:SdrD B-like domain-containing protein n=1 Tax=Schaalia suimastitidis TaxID=121163 RepID=UPI000423C277|nr:SdrD B-like domain-containing protein [Schaalia suimastitidis]